MAGSSPERTRAYVCAAEMLSSSATSARVRNRGGTPHSLLHPGRSGRSGARPGQYPTAADGVRGCAGTGCGQGLGLNGSDASQWVEADAKGGAVPDHTVSRSPGTLLPAPTLARRLSRPSWRDPRLLVGVLLVLGSVTAGSLGVGAGVETPP